MKAVGRTDIGRCRKNNEDAYFISDEDYPVRLLLIADGMGGCNAGEVASATAVEAFTKYVEEKLPLELDNPEKLLTHAVDAANRAVFELANEKMIEMGTTLVAVLIDTKKIYVVHVGDSRAYLLRKKDIFPLTIDHSYVMELVRLGSITAEEAAVHPKRNIITRAVGIKEEVEADITTYSIKKGDVLLLCSDGLSGMMKDEEMQEIIKRKITFEKKAEKLVEEANARGGYDNITLILAEV